MLDSELMLFSKYKNLFFLKRIEHVIVVQSLSRIRLFVTPWTEARQASLSFTFSQSLLKLMSIESMMPSNHLILCPSLLLLPSIFPSIRVFPVRRLFASSGQSRFLKPTETPKSWPLIVHFQEHGKYTYTDTCPQQLVCENLLHPRRYPTSVSMSSLAQLTLEE